jgi:hypothetical protein
VHRAPICSGPVYEKACALPKKLEIKIAIKTNLGIG